MANLFHKIQMMNQHLSYSKDCVKKKKQKSRQVNSKETRMTAIFTNPLLIIAIMRSSTERNLFALMKKSRLIFLRDGSGLNSAEFVLNLLMGIIIHQKVLKKKQNTLWLLQEILTTILLKI